MTKAEFFKWATHKNKILEKWTDIDLAYYDVGKALNMFEEPFWENGKTIIYNDENPITKSLRAFFVALEENDLIEYNEDGQVKFKKNQNAINDKDDKFRVQ